MARIIPLLSLVQVEPAKGGDGAPESKSVDGWGVIVVF